MEQINGILFIDIETVPLKPEYHQLPENLQHHWDKKSKTIKTGTDADSSSQALYTERAGVYSEFAKVVCIGFGSITKTGEVLKMRLKALANENEQKLLSDFASVLEKFSKFFTDFSLCGHNIKEFDLPFLCRRMIINGVTLPSCMQVQGKKPWEITHLDTMELWKFGDHKHYTTLALMADIFGIPSPKNDIDGSMVATVYYKQKDLQRIANYCMQDVLTTARVYLKLKGFYDVEIEPVFLKD
jgi:3'-5' exonuclease